MNKSINFLKEYALGILLLFYTVGVVGMGFINQNFFASLTPAILLLSTLLIFISHHQGVKNIGWLFLCCLVFGYFAEWVGISYGLPFGEYKYGQTLGIAVSGVPLIIGVNWFLLTISAGFLAGKMISNNFGRIIIASGLMVLTDIFIEPVAQVLDYWQWEKEEVPAVNYLGWFGVGLIMQTGFLIFLRKETNSLAVSYYIVVTTFFVLMNWIL